MLMSSSNSSKLRVQVRKVSSTEEQAASDISMILMEKKSQIRSSCIMKKGNHFHQKI